MARPITFSQRGGITILVALSLLVLLTVAAVGMSRNSLREMMIVGSTRQAASVRQAADSGIEYAILWSDPQNQAVGAGAVSFQTTARALLESPENQGDFKTLALGEDSKLHTGDSSTGFELKLLRLGKLPDTLSSVPDERLYPDIWVTRSTGQVTVGGLTFRHDKELWLTTPALTK